MNGHIFTKFLPVPASTKKNGILLHNTWARQKM